MNDVIGEILADVYARGKANQQRLDERYLTDQEEMSYQSDIILQSKIAIENYYRINPLAVENPGETK